MSLYPTIEYLCTQSAILFVLRFEFSECNLDKTGSSPV
jgi:hypothetical protein